MPSFLQCGIKVFRCIQHWMIRHEIIWANVDGIIPSSISDSLEQKSVCCEHYKKYLYKNHNISLTWPYAAFPPFTHPMVGFCDKNCDKCELKSSGEGLLFLSNETGHGMLQDSGHNRNNHNVCQNIRCSKISYHRLYCDRRNEAVCGSN